MKADGILDQAGRFDIDQPTEYLGRISQKDVVPAWLTASGQKKGASQRTPTPTENIREANASHAAHIAARIASGC
jgi:hypothetical protein